MARQEDNNQSAGAPFEDPLCDYEPKTYDDPLEQALAEQPVSEIQLHPYAHVTSDTTVGRAMQALAGLRISSLLVIDGGKLLGVFTERDVLERVADRYQELRDQPVSTVMTDQPVVVRDSDPLGAALAAIVAGGYRHVPVIGLGDEVLGIVSPRRVVAGLKPLRGS
jgi:CBS domain-containing protein